MAGVDRRRARVAGGRVHRVDRSRGGTTGVCGAGYSVERGA
ncbi:hypothetical protein BN903_1 [Halorubrum sp. AJ67]|nr:hypothetical protein BN903_1 [Halorubrum sp. AJ67]